MRKFLLSAREAWIAAACGALVVAMWLALGYRLERDAEATMARARAEGQNLARSLAEHVASSVRVLDLILIDLREEWISRDTRFDQQVRRLRDHLDKEQVSQVLVTDADGRVAYSSLPGAVGLNLAARGFFHAIKQGDPHGLYISAPQFDEEAAQWSIKFARPILDGKDRFAGVISLVLPVPALEHIYNDIALGPGSVIALVRADGQILARSRDMARANVVSLAETPGLSPDAPEAGSYVRASRTDGVERLYVFQKVRGGELTVYVGQATRTIMAPHRADRFAYSASGAAVTLLLALVAWLLISRLRVRARAERALKQKVEHLQLIYDTSSVAIFDVDKNARITHANRRMAEMFGTSLEQIVGVSYLDLVHPGQRAEASVTTQDLISGKADHQDLERCYVRADGGEFWGHVTSRCLLDTDGKIVNWVGVIVDVTEERQVREELRQKIADLQLVYDTSSAGIFNIDWRGVITHANRRMGEMFGMPPEDMIGRESVDLVHPSQREDGRRAIVAVMSGEEELLERDRHYLRADGSEFWGRISGRRMLDASGAVIGMVGVIIDTTEARLALDQLRRNEAQMRELFDAFPFAISHVDKSERISFANRIYREFYGDYRGLTVREYVGDEAYARIKPAIDSALAGEFYSYERRAADKQGNEHVLLLRYIPDRDASGRVVGYFAVRENITDRRRAEEEIRKLNEDLERRVRQRTSELSAANAALKAEVLERQAAESEALQLAHRLRDTARRLGEAQELERRHLAAELHDGVSSNLAAIGLNLAMLKRQIEGGERARLEQRLNGLIARVDETKAAVKDISIDLRPLLLEERDLRSALEDYARKFATSTGIAVAVKAASAGRHLGAEKKIALFRIMQEALANCAKHARARAVQVEFEAGADRLLLSVSDDGIGIDLSESQERRHGLGLLSMQERAESIGALWQIESAPGKGTRIRVEAAP